MVVHSSNRENQSGRRLVLEERQSEALARASRQVGRTSSSFGGGLGGSDAGLLNLGEKKISSPSIEVGQRAGGGADAWR